MKEASEYTSLVIQRSPTAFWFACVDVDVLEDERLTPIEKVVFSLLCRYANPQNRAAYPSIKTLAQKANCSEFSVQKAIKHLIEFGLIERQERFIGGRQTTSLYRIIGFEAPCYRLPKEDGGSNTLTPPPTTLTDGGQRDVPQKDTSMKDIITLTGEANLPDSVETEKTTKAETVPNPEERFTPEDAPDIMLPTAELLLLKTGRKFLAWEEILALRELSASQMPARVQKEIDRACERFARQGKPLSSLRFEYIASALRSQPTRGKKAKNKSQPEDTPQEVRTCTDEQAEAEMARIAELQAKFDMEVQ